MSKKTINGQCKCCVNYYHRETPTLISESEEDELCYQVTGMCTACYRDTNHGEFNKESQEATATY